MSKGIGRQISFGVAKETVRGTPESAAAFWIPFEELDIAEKDEKALDEQSNGLREDSTQQIIIKQWGELSGKFLIGDKSFPLVLLSTLGSLSTASNADGSGTIKDHTITVAQNAQIQALSLFVDDPLGGQDYKHGLGCVDSLELAYEQGKYIGYTLKMMSKKGVTASNTPAVSNENRFAPQHLTFKLASTQAGLGAASPVVIKSLKLKFSNNLEADTVLGSLAPADYLARKLTIEGEVEAIWQNETDFKTFTLAGTQKAMRIDLTNSDVTIGTSANPKVVIDLYKVIFSELSRPFKVNDVIRQSLQFKVHYSVSDSKMINITATNAQTSY